jgi:TolB-like protein/Tfp pilus assembly protein PilF
MGMLDTLILTRMTPDVFISYSSNDKIAADTVCSVLEQKNISCWMAPRDITPGLDFAEAIIDGIKSSKVFILVYSSSSNRSSQVIREVDRAVHHGLPIITIRLEDVSLSKQLEYYLSSVHWFDAMTPPLEEHINRLSGVVKMLLGKHDGKNDDLEKAILNGTLTLGKGRTISTALSGRKFRKVAVFKWAVPGAMLLATLLIVFLLLKQKLSPEAPLMNKSIAVLPFTNLSNDPEQEYFVEGMHDEILDRIFKIGDLKAISRTSSMRYRNSRLSLKEIARELEVESILEGSVRKIGDNVRITVQLIDAKTDTHLWSEIYDRSLSDIFSIQSEIAQTIAKELHAVITPQEKALIEKPYTASSEAYEAYLKGKNSWRKLTPTGLDSAIHYFQRALEKDPEFALAYAGMAHVWTARRQFGISPPREATAKAEQFIRKALEFDNTSSEIYYVLATHLVWGLYDWSGGEAAYRKAIEINPNHAESQAYYSHLLTILGRPEEGIKHIEKAVELDPYSSLIRGLYGAWLGHVGRYEEAIREVLKSKELDPTQPVGTINYYLYVLGKEEEAFREFRKNFKDHEYLKAVDDGYAEGGYKGAQKKLADLRVEKAKGSYISPMIIANNYAVAGEYDKSIYWLEVAYEARDPSLPYVTLRHWYSEIREDPRFQDLCRKLNLPY